jgi:hypothetical protein
MVKNGISNESGLSLQPTIGLVISAKHLWCFVEN